MRNTTSNMLVQRDPALATLMGADHGADFGQDFGAFGGDFSDPNMGYEFGFEFGADGGGGNAQHLYAQAQAEQARTNARSLILEPNRGSKVKVERYAFYVNQDFVLGAAVAINANAAPATNLRPQRVSMNAPTPGFATITDLQVANVGVIVGGTADAFEYNPNGVGQSLDMPTLSPANRATVKGNYTGFTPPGFVAGTTFTFAVGLKGPASIIA